MEKMGQMICTYRKLNGISQEELARIVGVSAGAVSKWERDISIPDLDVLCNLADYFQVTIDELIGRNKKKIIDIQFENKWEANRYFVALELIECCNTARSKGLLAVEERLKEKDESAFSFLKYAVHFILEGFQKNMPLGKCKELLLNYAEAEKDTRTAIMVCEVIVLIFSGENEEMIREVLSSFLGRKYAGLILQEKQMDRMERIENIADYETGFADTGILNGLISKDDYHIQLMLRQLDNDDFVQALLGTSKEVRIRLLQNLSDRMLSFISEDIRKASGDIRSIEDAQNNMMKIMDFFKTTQ